MLRENHLEELNFGFPCILEINILAISNLVIVKILLHLPNDEKNLLLHYNVIKTYLGRGVGTGGAGVTMAPPVFSEEPKRGI